MKMKLEKNDHKFNQLYEDEKRVIEALAKNGPLSVREIERFAGIDRNIIQRKLRVLGKMGLVKLYSRREVDYWGLSEIVKTGDWK